MGSYVVQEALLRGHRVIAVRRKGSVARIRFRSEPEWVVGDLDSTCLEQMRGCDAVIHCAAAGVSPQKTSWIEAQKVNVEGTVRLLENARGAEVSGALILGTCHEYGTSSTRYERIPIDAPLEPIGPYAASKAASSLMALAFAREASMRLTVARPFNLYGEGQHESNFWPQLRRAAAAGEDFMMSGGEQVRDFLHVSVAASRLMDLAEDLPEPGKPEVVHVASGCAITLAEFARKVWAEAGARGKLRIGALPYREGEPMRIIPDVAPGGTVKTPLVP